VDDAFAKTTLKTAQGLAGVMGRIEDELARLNDPFVSLAGGLAPLQQKLRYVRQRRSAEQSKLTALLYNADTTGGNSGSPLMNARGELVGVNFDRAWGATINDYAWNEAYSRSIAVDIRYVLWVTEKSARRIFC